MRKQYPLLLLAFLLLTTFAHATTCETWTEISGDVDITEPGCYSVVADYTHIKFTQSIDGNVIIDLNGHKEVYLHRYECEINGTLEIFNGTLHQAVTHPRFSVKEYKLHDLNVRSLWLQNFERLVIDNVVDLCTPGYVGPTNVSVTKEQADVRISNYAGSLIINVLSTVSESNVVITQSNFTSFRARTASPSVTLTLSDVNLTYDTVILWPADKLTLDNVYLDGRPLQYNNDPSTWEPDGAYLVDTLPSSSPVNVYYVGATKQSSITITQDYTYAEHIGVYSVEDINGYTGTVAIYDPYIEDVYDSNVNILSSGCCVHNYKNTATIYNSEVTLIQPYGYGALEIRGSELNAEGSTIHAWDVRIWDSFENNYKKIVGGNFYVSSITSTGKEAPMYLEMNYWAPSIESPHPFVPELRPYKSDVVVITGTTIDAEYLHIWGNEGAEIHFKDVTFTQPITIICYNNQTVYFEGTTNTDNVTVSGCTLGTPIEQPICETWGEISGTVEITEPGCYRVVADDTHIKFTQSIDGNVIIDLNGHEAYLHRYPCEINGTLEIFNGTIWSIRTYRTFVVKEYKLHDLNAYLWLPAFDRLTINNVSGSIEMYVTNTQTVVNIENFTGSMYIRFFDTVSEGNVLITQSNFTKLRIESSIPSPSLNLILSDVNLTYDTAIYWKGNITIDNVYLDGRPLQYNNDPSTWEPDGAYLVDTLPSSSPVNVYYVGATKQSSITITQDYTYAEHIGVYSAGEIRGYTGTVAIINPSITNIYDSNVTILSSRHHVSYFRNATIHNSEVAIQEHDRYVFLEIFGYELNAEGSTIYARKILFFTNVDEDLKIVGGNLHVTTIGSYRKGKRFLIGADYWTGVPGNSQTLSLEFYKPNVAIITGTTIDAEYLHIWGNEGAEIHFKDVTFAQPITIVCKDNQTVYFEGTTNKEKVTLRGCVVPRKPTPGFIGGIVEYLTTTPTVYVSGKINEQKSVTIPVFWNGVYPTKAEVIYKGSVTGPTIIDLKQGKNIVNVTVRITGSGDIGSVTFKAGPYKATATIYSTVLAQGALPVSVDGSRLLTIALVLAVLYFFLARR